MATRRLRSSSWERIFSCRKKDEGVRSYRFLVFPTLITDILMPNLPSIQPQRYHKCHPPKKI